MKNTIKTNCAINIQSLKEENTMGHKIKHRKTWFGYTDYGYQER